MLLKNLRLAYKLAQKLSVQELQSALEHEEDPAVDGDGKGTILPFMTEDEAFEYVKDTQGGWGKLKEKIKAITSQKE